MTDDLTSLYDAAKAATPGPWTIDVNGRIYGNVDGGLIGSICYIGNLSANANDNARLIAAANPARILALIDELRAAKGCVEALKRCKVIAYGLCLDVRQAAMCQSIMDEAGNALAAYDAVRAKAGGA